MSERVIVLKEAEVRNIIQSLDTLEVKGFNNMQSVMTAIRILGEATPYKDSEIEIKKDLKAPPVDETMV